MKQAGWLLLGVLCSAMLLFAADKGKHMSGTICNSACVVSQSGLPTCDIGCTATGGDCVLVGDKGHVMKIENPEVAMPHMGKHVKLMATSAEKINAAPSEKEREESIRIMELYEEAP
jgi:hypothetical protein